MTANAYIFFFNKKLTFLTKKIYALSNQETKNEIFITAAEINDIAFVKEITKYCDIDYRTYFTALKKSKERNNDVFKHLNKLENKAIHLIKFNTLNILILVMALVAFRLHIDKNSDIHKID